MKKEPRELLNRIEAYSPDHPGAPFPYSARLARDNRWTSDYTRRVIREYKRFAYLAVAAGHPVTPSDQVDQAWHLHMIYTKSYWEEFCRDILGAPLHHSPTKGGGAEQGKFIDWYARTLDSYRRQFGEEPPADIWPSAARRFGEDIRFLRVNAERNWVLRKPGWWRCLAAHRPRFARLRLPARLALTTLAPVLLLALALAGCNRGVGNGFIAPGISGEEFIWLFLVLGVIGPIFATVLRNSLRRTKARSAIEIDDYSTAYLTGGRSRLLDSIIVNLVRRNHLAYDKGNATLSALVSGTELPAPNLDPLEQKVYGLIPTTPAAVGLKDLRQTSRSLFAPTREALHENGLLLTPSQAAHATLWPLLMAITVPLFGGMRILSGLSQGKSVGYLIILTAILGIVVVGIFGRCARRSLAGDRLVRRLKKKNRNLQRRPVGDALPVAVGLYGVACLQGTEYADLAPTLTPKSGSSGGCGGGCGGSDGGGDGCGGGGCGGCGGCGG